MAPQKKRGADGPSSASKRRTVPTRQQVATAMLTSDNHHEGNLPKLKLTKRRFVKSESKVEDSESDPCPPSSAFWHSNDHSDAAYILAAWQDGSKFAASLQENVNELFSKATAFDMDFYRKLHKLLEPSQALLARCEAILNKAPGSETDSIEQ